MTFSNPLFYLVFLPVALIGFQLVGRFGRRPAIAFLVLMSIVFYAEWSRTYVLVLLGSIAANYLFAIALERTRNSPRLQTLWLAAGIAANIGALCYFKYLFPLLRFFTASGLSHREWKSVVLPLGISFFTFTQIAYLVDLKQGVAKLQDLSSYTLFVTFFPHLIAGPIIHHKDLMPQFARHGRYRLNRDDFAVGLTWFTMGMFKKVMVADRIAPTADALFAHPQGQAFFSAWLGVIIYSMQLYFDFSGYSDMALGLARMFSIRFPLNFNSPYKSQSIIDFWQRWHITLTRYIMDYVYSPLLFSISRRRMERGKKVSRKASATLEGFSSMIALPTLFTLFLAGVWHGAGMQFLLYGLLHGSYITINHAWRIFVPATSRLKRLMTAPVCILLTYASVLVGEVLFRAESLRSSFVVFSDMRGRFGLGRPWTSGEAVLVLVLLAVVWLMPNTQEILGQQGKDDAPNWSILPHLRWQPTLAWSAATAATFALSMFYSTASTTFLYFQF